MNELEQLVRQTLAERAAEAPPAADLLSRVHARVDQPRRSWLTPALAAIATAAVVAVAGISVLIGTHRSSADHKRILAKRHGDGIQSAPAIVVDRAAATVLIDLASDSQNPEVQWVRTTAGRWARIDTTQPSASSKEAVYVIQVVAPIVCNDCSVAAGTRTLPRGHASVLMTPVSPTSQLPDSGLLERKPLDLRQLGSVHRFQFPYGARRPTPALTGLTVKQAMAVARAAGFTAAVNLPTNKRVDPNSLVVGQIDLAGKPTRLHVVVLILKGQ